MFVFKYIYGAVTPQWLDYAPMVDYNLGDSKSQRASKLHYWFKSYGNFAEKSEFFLLDKVVKLVGGWSVINGAYSIYFCKAIFSS